VTNFTEKGEVDWQGSGRELSINHAVVLSQSPGMDAGTQLYTGFFCVKPVGLPPLLTADANQREKQKENLPEYLRSLIAGAGRGSGWPANRGWAAMDGDGMGLPWLVYPASQQ